MNAKSRDKNRAGIPSAMARMRYVRKDERKASRRAALVPKMSPNRPKSGPPRSVATANTVCM